MSSILTEATAGAAMVATVRVGGFTRAQKSPRLVARLYRQTFDRCRTLGKSNCTGRPRLCCGLEIDLKLHQPHRLSFRHQLGPTDMVARAALRVTRLTSHLSQVRIIYKLQSVRSPVLIVIRTLTALFDESSAMELPKLSMN